MDERNGRLDQNGGVSRHVLNNLKHEKSKKVMTSQRQPSCVHEQRKNVKVW